MQRRQITIGGGRYLIFYSFEDEPGLEAAPPATRADARDRQPAQESAREPAAEPSAEGEPHV